ncbi:hypothetical protein DICPUDRAFT_151077 [Dictyostelium purpureum]|uniref:Uncharacterized protein n=1 Tax=Dictyostelium purpureum TaxID=5786 RepID=F0ZHY0_DICPU|nr:uncharacterized protein DICPUDRAFT_151077 [Dictyostelium purpureum]EGC36446.1 hypothetical protein DICPUDRAFT_151077 [Dictyostelium purpureum]|eukprot:XP_003287018.1 hypothetical protein DICPUDRAFT_151077 [Dictyostelium purpureum]
MKRNRFFLVQSTTKFTDDQIKRIAGEMSDISYYLVEGIKVCTLDENIYKYILNSDSKEKYIQDNNKSPIICIPRKPHANGLLSYMVGTFLELNKGWLATISDSSSSNINTLLKDTLKDDKSWIAIELDGYYKVCKIDERDEKVPTFKSIATTGFKTQNREVNPIKSTQKKKRFIKENLKEVPKSINLSLFQGLPKKSFLNIGLLPKC